MSFPFTQTHVSGWFFRPFVVVLVVRLLAGSPHRQQITLIDVVGVTFRRSGRSGQMKKLPACSSTLPVVVCVCVCAYVW